MVSKRYEPDSGSRSDWIERFAVALTPEGWMIVGTISLVIGASLILGKEPTVSHSMSTVSAMGEPALLNCLGGPPAILATMDRWAVPSNDRYNELAEELP